MDEFVKRQFAMPHCDESDTWVRAGGERVVTKSLIPSANRESLAYRLIRREEQQRCRERQDATSTDAVADFIENCDCRFCAEVS
jgi:hypothetical protein